MRTIGGVGERARPLERARFPSSSFLPPAPSLALSCASSPRACTGAVADHRLQLHIIRLHLRHERRLRAGTALPSRSYPPLPLAPPVPKPVPTACTWEISSGDTASTRVHAAQPCVASVKLHQFVYTWHRIDARVCACAVVSLFPSPSQDLSPPSDHAPSLFHHLHYCCLTLPTHTAEEEDEREWGGGGSGVE